MNKIISVYKPVGLSSFDIIRKFKKENEIDFKVGHGGTLDPFACGLVLLLLGKKTKEFDKIRKWKKTYLAGIKIGNESSTLDVSGEIKNLEKVFFSFEELKEKLDKIAKEEYQTVPFYSAAKHNGKPLYKLAKKGIEIEKKKKVKIEKIEIIAYKYPLLTIRVGAYGGTYIRQIASDLGKELRTGAMLYFLEREKIGRYGIKNAKRINNLKI